MGKVIAVQLDILSSLSTDYLKYGENIYGIYKTEINRIERELEAILKNYSEYRSVINKVYELREGLKEIEFKMKNVQGRAYDISRNLHIVAASYAKAQEEEIKIIKNMKNEMFKGDKTVSAINIQSNDSDSLIDSLLKEPSEYMHLIAGIQKRTGKTVSDIKGELSEIISQLMGDPGDCLEALKTIILTVNKNVQHEWDDYYDIYSRGIKNIQHSLGEFGINANLKFLTDVQLNDIANYIMEHMKEDESGILPENLKELMDRIFPTLVSFPHPYNQNEGIGDIWESIYSRLPLTPFRLPITVAFSMLNNDNVKWNEFFEVIKNYYVDAFPAGLLVLPEKFFSNVLGVDVETYRDWQHTILDVAGFIPGYGAIADLANALFYMREDQWVDGLTSLVIAIPGVGDLVGLFKMSKKTETLIEQLGFSVDIADYLESLLGNEEKTESHIDIGTIINNVEIVPHVISRVTHSVSDIKSNLKPEISQMSTPQDFFELPQTINIAVDKAIQSEWEVALSPLKDLQNSVTDFVFDVN